MPKGNQSTVIFSCPECGASYQATQEHCPDVREGSFNCQDCEAEVLVWAGKYDYLNWKPFGHGSCHDDEQREIVKKVRKLLH